MPNRTTNASIRESHFHFKQTTKMPPKKKARVSQAASPAATDQHKTPTPAAQSPSKADEDVLNDPWTDEEAIGLFKAVIKWKPTGKR
jgi:MRG-binding protein